MIKGFNVEIIDRKSNNPDITMDMIKKYISAPIIHYFKNSNSYKFNLFSISLKDFLNNVESVSKMNNLLKNRVKSINISINEEYFSC